MTDYEYPAALTHDLSREELLNHLQNRLDDARFQHCLRVEETARQLATRFHADVDRAGLAGLFHDYAKQVPIADYKRVIMEDGFDPALLQYGRGVWHGMVGTWFIQTEVGLTDRLVLQAIERHTTGDPAMTLLDQIIFVADFIEPARTLDAEVAARAAALTDMRQATFIELKNTLQYLIANNKIVYPKTLLTFNAFIPKEG